MTANARVIATIHPLASSYNSGAVHASGERR